MVERVLVNVYAAPDTLVVLVDGDDADAPSLTGQVSLPQGRVPRFANDGGSTSILTVSLLFFDFICAIGELEPVKYG